MSKHCQNRKYVGNKSNHAKCLSPFDSRGSKRFSIRIQLLMSKIFKHRHPAAKCIIHFRSFSLVKPIVHASDLRCLGFMMFSHFPGASSVATFPHRNLTCPILTCITPSMICVVCPDRLSNGQWADSYFWKCEACSSQAASSHLGPSLPGTRFTCLASHRNAVSTTDCNDAFNVAEFKHGHLSIE